MSKRDRLRARPSLPARRLRLPLSKKTSSIASAAFPHARERICWSRTLKLPLAVEREEKGAWSPAVTADEARPRPIAAAIFPVAHEGTRIDVGRDLD